MRKKLIYFPIYFSVLNSCNIIDQMKRRYSEVSNLEISNIESLNDLIIKRGLSIPIILDIFFPQDISIIINQYEYYFEGRCDSILNEHYAITCLTVFPINNEIHVASGSLDGKIKIWTTLSQQNPSEIKSILTFLNDRPVTCMAAILSNDSNAQEYRLVCGLDDGKINVWNPQTKLCENTLIKHNNVVTCITVLPDGKFITGSYDGTLRMWNVYELTGEETDQNCLILKQNQGSLFDIAIFPNNPPYIICGSCNSTIKIFDIKQEKKERLLEGHTCAVSCITILPDYTKNKMTQYRIVSGSYDGTIKVWTISSQRNTNDITIITGSGYVRCIAVLPDGRIAGGFDNGTIKIWNLRNKKCEKIIIGHTEMVYCLTILPGDNWNYRIVSGSKDRSIKIWS